MIRNEAIRGLPMPTKTEVTVETITNLKARQNQLKEDIELNKHKQRYKKNLEKEYIDIINNINRLEAEVRNTNPDDVPEELLKDIATLKNKHHELQGLLRRHDKQRQRVEDIQDKADDLQFNNNVVSQQLQETPRSKKTRDDAEAQAVQTMVEAKKQEELNQTRQMTHKSEQDKRVLEMTANAQQSKKAKELDAEIINAKAEGKIADAETEQYEELDRVRKNTRYARISRDTQKQVNEHMRSHSGIEDATTTLTVMNDAMQQQFAAEDRFNSRRDELVGRFEKNPAEFDIYNKVIRKEGCNTLDTVEDLRNSIQTPDNLDKVANFFEYYDRGEIHVEDSDDSDW
jgi:hypothetical protein